jgi:hypothetical protein
VCPARYVLGSYIPEDGILRSHRRENLKSYAVTLVSNVTTKRIYDDSVAE